MDFDATGVVDQFLVNYEPVTLIIWIALIAVVIGVISLGTEFWVSIWGIIHSPSLTFQRILGEAQTIPGLVILLVGGLATAAIMISYLSDPPIREWFQELDIGANRALALLIMSTDEMLYRVGWDKALHHSMDYMQDYAFQAWVLAVIVPVAFIVNWLLFGVAGQLASMIAGNKAGHGITNLWSTYPYVFLLNILTTWFFFMWLHGSAFAGFMLGLTAAWLLFLHVVMMREHGRYQISKAIFATILTPIIGAILNYLLMVLSIIVYVYASGYL